MCAGQDRLAGYRAAVEASGRRYDESLVSVGDFTAAGGHAATLRLLERRPDVDAIFAASDLAAFGVVRALRERGRRVGDDVAVIGFDDIPAAAEQQPPLSTVQQPIAALGTAMTRLLLDRIEGRTRPAPSHRPAGGAGAARDRLIPAIRRPTRRNWPLTR